MTRFAYFLFNLLLVAAIYAMVYFFGQKDKALLYTVEYFSAPYIALNFFMAIYCLVRWFVTHNHDAASDGVTFLHTTWFVSVVTFIAYELVNAGSVVKLVAKVKTGI